MNGRDREQWVRRMADTVVSRGQRTRIENAIGMLYILLSVGVMIFLFSEQTPRSLEDGLLIVLFLTIYTIPLVVVRMLRKRRRASLLECVMPSDPEGNRTLDQEAYQHLSAECRAIEEAYFRREQAKAFKKIR